MNIKGIIKDTMDGNTDGWQAKALMPFLALGELAYKKGFEIKRDQFLKNSKTPIST